MSNDESRLRRPVMRRATEAGCAGWTPITRLPAEPAPASGRPADESAASASTDEGEPPAASDLANQ